MYEVMINEIIPEYAAEDQPELKHAADQWRFPFWDWATKKPQKDGPPNYDIPNLIKEKYVEIRTPKGTEKVINPFWGFRMKDGVVMGDSKLAPDVVTRDPVSLPNATTSPALIVDSTLARQGQVVMRTKMAPRKRRPTLLMNRRPASRTMTVLLMSSRSGSGKPVVPSLPL